MMLLKGTGLSKPLSWSLVLLASLCSNAASAATKYVDNSGAPACSNSTSNGSEAQPWCTVAYGVSHIVSGDTLYVKRGTYNEAFTISGPSGTTSAHTVISAYPGHTPILRGSGFSSGRMKITGGCSYIDFIGFEITNYNQGLYLDDDAGTSTPCTNLIVRGVHIHDVGQEGLAVRAGSATGPRSFLIENSEIDHTGRLSPNQNGEGMYIGNSSGTDVTNGVTARNNKIHDTPDECVELKGDSHDNIIEFNELYNCLSPGSSFGNTGGAIEIDEPRNTSTNPNQIIRANTIHDIAFTSGITKRGIRAGTGATIYDNVLYNISSSYSCILSNSSNFPRLIYHNTVDCTTANAIVNSGTTVDIRNNIGPAATGNLAFNAAFFVNAAGRDYHLVAGSAPINAGADLTSVVAVDKDGNNRLIGSAPDDGAYEYGSGTGSPPAAPTNLQIIVQP
jgi:hypothetical protein